MCFCKRDDVNYNESGDWERRALGDGCRWRPSQLRMPSTYCTLCKYDFLVQSAGIPCKDMQFSYMGRGV